MGAASSKHVGLDTVFVKDITDRFEGNGQDGFAEPDTSADFKDEFVGPLCA